ncbi:hypothetical protein [Janthinobacterium agaricidamnosum]|uniref:Uncharacterized protein n=1 Tax=Janthinobacterium agaricidamnosum NBRC 102515 = DSM 9628 TaxID=1349767 RepID=W0V640_9BURK|nr:hypothetical protein [Janthinobacterium agaricidamnosum]CDG83346.1 hypothetical protein GJA_2715 [Janthinobacterium agaricidamnosum NBRC 102515 = DSM 9628]
MSGSGFGISYGTRTTTVDQERDATTQIGGSAVTKVPYAEALVGRIFYR